MPMRPYHWFSAYSQHESDRRRWPKRIKPWNGPIRQAFICPEGEPIVLDIRSHADMGRISTLPQGIIGVATQSSDETWSGQHDHPGYPLSNVYLNGPYNDVESVTEAIRASYTAHVQEEERIAASPTLQLERVLRNRDWTSHMSDDHSVWSAGQRNDRDLNRVLPTVPVEDARRLWAQYAPSDIHCPV